MWRAALSSRLRTIRCSSSGLPSTASGTLVLDRQLAIAHRRSDLDGRVAGDLGQVAAPVRAPTRPASARASSSRSATSRLIRCEERSAESTIARSSSVARLPQRGLRAARGWRGCWSAACAARARRRRRTRAASSSPPRARLRAASRERSICSSVRASSPTSSSIFGSGMWREGSPVSAISRAVAVSEEIGRIARRGDRQPGEAGEQGAAEDPGGDEEPEPVDGRVDVGDAAPVLDVTGDQAGGRRVICAVATRICPTIGEAPGQRPQVGGPGALLDQVAVDVEDSGRGVVGAHEVVEAGAFLEGDRAERGVDDAEFRWPGSARRRSPRG